MQLPPEQRAFKSKRTGSVQGMVTGRVFLVSVYCELDRLTTTTTILIEGPSNDENHALVVLVN